MAEFQPLADADDDPTCLYVFGFFGFLIPLIGFIGMCVYGCGQNLPPKQKSAFTCMCIATAVGFIIGVIIVATQS